MKFFIVTPSYNQLDWLKLCIASVADQVAPEAQRSEVGDQRSAQLTADVCLLTSGSESSIHVHHHVQDACSTDGTADWLERYAQEVRGQRSEVSAPNAQCPAPSAYSFSFSSEKDEGMYDAINQGWKQAPDDVDVVAHLNCDEQYLPDVLQTISTFFSNHRKVDVVLADMIVINAEGDYICHRRSLQPYVFTSRYCVGGFTATTFQRASVTKQKQVFFDTSWKNFGDKVWYNALHKAGCTFSICNEMVSVFADTGANLNWTEEGMREKKRYEDEFLHGRSIGTKVIARTLGLRRALKELILKAPVNYSLYLQGKELERTVMPIRNPTGLWHKKWKK